MRTFLSPFLFFCFLWEFHKGSELQKVKKIPQKSSQKGLWFTIGICQVYVTKLQLPNLWRPQIYNNMCVIISWLVRLHGPSSTGGRPAAGDVRSRRASGGPLGGPCGPLGGLLGGPSGRLSGRPSVCPAGQLSVRPGGHSSRVWHSICLRHSSRVRHFFENCFRYLGYLMYLVPKVPVGPVVPANLISVWWPPNSSPN